MRTNDISPGPSTCLFKFCSAGCAQKELWFPGGGGGLDPGTLCLWAGHRRHCGLSCQTPPRWKVLNARSSQGGKSLQVTEASPPILHIKKMKPRNSKCLPRGHTSHYYVFVCCLYLLSDPEIPLHGLPTTAVPTHRHGAV